MMRPEAYIEYSDVMLRITGPILQHIDRLPDNFFFFLEEDEKTGVYMPHGIADKDYHVPGRLNQCEALLYPGPLWRDKFVAQGVAKEKICIVGWPRLDPWYQGLLPYRKGNRPRVVWLPTHDAIPFVSSYPRFIECLLLIPDTYEVISSVHPARRENRTTSLELLAQADVVLADSSGCLYEAWAMGKPVIFLDWLVKRGVVLRDTFEGRIYREGIGYHAESFQHLLKLIPRALAEGVDPKAGAFIDAHFSPELRGVSGKAAADVLKRWL